VAGDAMFHGRTLDDAFAWCLGWVITPEIGIAGIWGDPACCALRSDRLAPG
jgi:hypothetical protein